MTPIRYESAVPLRGTEKNTGAIFVRGVGAAAKDESLKAATVALAEYGFDPILTREVNWSWADFVAWPYLKDEAGKQEPTRTLTPGNKFLRQLGSSVLNSAARDLPSHSQWARVIVKVLYVAMFPSTLVPLFVIIIPTLLGLHLLSGKILLTVFMLLFVPIAIASISLDPGLIRATFRTVALRIFWPVFFPISVVLSYGWAPLLYTAITVGTVTTVSLLLPEHARYIIAGDRPDTFEPSLWLQILQAGAFIIASSLAILLAGALLRELSRPFAFLFKVMADIFRYLGDTSYRMGIQEQLANQISELADRGTKHLFVFTHSLGTVIAIDLFRNVPPTGFISIVLVTSGSPLRRFFWRFFAHDYEQPAHLLYQVTSGLSVNNTRFEWLNVYRRRDPVGGPLNLPPGHECAVTKAGETLLNAHLNYWNDADVHRAVAKLLSSK